MIKKLFLILTAVLATVAAGTEAEHMAISKTHIRRWDMADGIIVRDGPVTIGEGDVYGDIFGIEVYDDGAPADLTGAGCSGLFIRQDGATVGLIGTVSGNIATVRLEEACYAVNGQYQLTIKLTKSGETVTARIVDGTVNRTTTDVPVDPGTIIPSIETLIEEIQAVAESIPEEYSDFYAAAEKFNGTLAATDTMSSLTERGYYRITSGTKPTDWSDTGKSSSVAAVLINYPTTSTSGMQFLYFPWNPTVQPIYRGKSSGTYGDWTPLVDVSKYDKNDEYKEWRDETVDNTAGSTNKTKYFDFYPGRHARSNMLFHIRARWTGTTVPVIYWYRTIDGESSTSNRGTWIPCGKKNKYFDQTIRIPRYRNTMIDDNVRLRVRIDVPAGTKVEIKEAWNEYDDIITPAVDNGIILCAHGKSGNLYPDNTMAAFTGAARLGYKYCITIPKRTSDGVFVCLHDDSSISATARNDDGTAIDPSIDKAVSQLTYTQLLALDFGIWRGAEFAGERIPLLAEFFKICATTGMHPMLSVHPSLEGYWGDIKAMAEKYGVLKTLNIKGGDSYISVPMAALGNDVESYTYDYSSLTANQAITNFTAKLTAANIDRTKVRCVIENMSESTQYTQADVTAIKTAGFEAGRANWEEQSTELTDCIEMGVTWFTDDYTPYAGCSWY